MCTRTKPTDFPRPELYRNPGTPPFRDEQGAYHVFCHAHVLRVLRNADEAFSRQENWLPADTRHMTSEFMWSTEPFTMGGEPGRHDALRAVVEPWFHTRAVRTMEPLIRQLTAELVDEVVATGMGKFDLARELAYPLAMRVICRLCGMEVDRERWLGEKLQDFSRAPSPADYPPQWDLQAYFWKLAAKRLARPNDELLDVLLRAWTAETISDGELLGYLFGFLAGGVETTGASLANAFALLSEHGQIEQLSGQLDNEQALARAVEEILRFGSAFPVLPLFVRKEAAFGDLVVPAGSILHVWFAAANRDEAVNAGVRQSPPTVFDPGRWPNRHLGLGHGMHYCLGAELARLEIRIALQEGLRRLPGLRLDDTKPFTRRAGIVDAVTEAAFTFDQPAAEKMHGRAPRAAG